MQLVHKRLLGLGLSLAMGGLALAVLKSSERADTAQEKAKAAELKLFAAAAAAAVDHVVLKTATATFELHRDPNAPGVWGLTQPLHAPAEAATVDALVTAAVALAGSARVAGTPDLALFGLDPPRYALSLGQGDKPLEEVHVGRANSFDGSLYARRAGSQDVFLVPSDIGYSLDQDVYKLRDKRPLAFEPNEVSELEVRVGGKPRFSLKANAAGHELTAPLQAPADGAQVNVILTALSSLRAQHFAAEGDASATALAAYGLNPPSHAVRLALKSGRRAELLFGSHLEPGGGKQHYVTLAGGHPVLELGSDWATQKLEIPLHELRDLRLFNFDQAAVRRVLLSRGKTRVELQRAPGEAVPAVWSVAGEGGGPADASKVAGLLHLLAGLKAEKIVAEPPKPANLAAAGLAPAAASIALFGADDAALGELRLGRAEGGMWLATTAAQARLDQLPQASLSEVGWEAAAYRPPPPAADAPEGAADPEPDAEHVDPAAGAAPP